MRALLSCPLLREHAMVLCFGDRQNNNCTIKGLLATSTPMLTLHGTAEREEKSLPTPLSLHSERLHIRENTLRKNFEAQLKEARTGAAAAAAAAAVPPTNAPKGVPKRPRATNTPGRTDTTHSPGTEAARRAAVKPSSTTTPASGAAGGRGGSGASSNSDAARTPQR